MEKRTLTMLVAVLFVIALILAIDLGVSGSPVRTSTATITEVKIVTTTATTSTATTSSETLTLSGGFVLPEQDCILGVPQNATISTFGQSFFNTTWGTVVTYSNGIQAFFPTVGCPQPVAIDYYQMATAAVTNNTFIAMENGSVYYFAGLGETVTLSGGQTAVALRFDYYNNQTVNVCGSGIGMRVLAEIQAFFPSAPNSTPVLSSPQYTITPEGSSTKC